ncbi:MAG: hypothetical protein ACRC14_15040 [Paracoccaceae bacterium]
MKLFRAKWIGAALAVGLLGWGIEQSNLLAPPTALGQFWVVTLQVEASASKYCGYSARLKAQLPDGRVGVLYAGASEMVMPKGTLICVHAATSWGGGTLALRRLPDARCGARPVVMAAPAP